MCYVELHCHSNFSFLDGASHPDDLIIRAAELGYHALALTDHNGLYGIVRFNQAANDHKIKPIFGSEITLDDDSHLILLIKNAAGYANLSQLLTLANLECEKGKTRVNLDLLSHYTEGLIALSGCSVGQIPSALINNNHNEARKAACQFREMFGDDFFLEIQHHNLPLHEFLCQSISRLSHELNIPLVATNNVHHATPDGRRLADILCCIKNHTTLDKADSILYPNHERYLKSAEQMQLRFAAYPDAISNTLAIADRCTFELNKLEKTQQHQESK
jgi:DNA polymerase-3 subunit alpha